MAASSARWLALAGLLLPGSLLGATAWAQSPAADWGLLLGLRRDGIIAAGRHGSFVVPAPDRYRTLWIRCVGGEVSAIELPAVQVPHEGVFWRVAVVRQTVLRWTEDRIMSSRPQQPSHWPAPRADRRRTTGYLTQRLVWVGRNYLTSWEESAGQKFDGSAPWLTDRLLTQSLETPETAVRIDQVLGRPALSTYEQSAQDFVHDHRRLPASVTATADAARWGMVRRVGTWIVSGQVGMGDGAFAIFDLPVEPEAVVGYDGLAPAWQEISDSLPSALDAVTAPQRQVVGVVLPGHLNLYRASDPVAWSNPRWTIALSGREVPVMTQWAEDVSRWDHDLTTERTAIVVRSHI